MSTDEREPHGTAAHIDRRRFLQSVGAMGAVGVFGGRSSRVPDEFLVPRSFQGPGTGQSSFVLHEMSVSALQRAYAEKRYSTEEVVDLYLKRIDQVDRAGPMLRAVIETNPDAHAIARELDKERAAGRIRGPLHGVPILLKDVIDTADRMHTTAGSLALLGSFPRRDAFIVERLRAAGAVILGKTNMSEWSNCRSTNGTSGWSARGGLTRNPYVLDRTAGGSSSGTGAAVSANLTMLGIGAETDGSIEYPASANGLVAVKPTVGLCSRSGVIPISFSQDTPGPFARTVHDAALLLGALTGVDGRDPATDASQRRSMTDYVSTLDAGALKGARIGVLRVPLDEMTSVAPAFATALEAIKSAGATLVEDLSLPPLDELRRAEVLVLLCEFKDAIREYLGTRGPEERHRSLADLIRFNNENAEEELRWFGQEWFEAAEVTTGMATPDYHRALAMCRQFSRTNGIDKTIADHQLDAIVSMAAGPAFSSDLLNGDHAMLTGSSYIAVAGYPRVTVPAALVSGLPLGISFAGLAWTEARLLSLAYAFEQATHARVAPRFFPTANFDR